MKHLLFVALAFGGICYAVHGSSAAPAPTQAQIEPTAWVECNDGTCTTRASCQQLGGTIGAPCGPGAICCSDF